MAVDFKDYARRMDKALDHLAEEFGAVRAGRANPKVLDRITVEYYGSETPLNGVATISSPDARTLVIQPWDTKLLKDIQKAIQSSDLGINPQNDGKVIRLVFPQLTEERRKDLAKQVVQFAVQSAIYCLCLYRLAHRCHPMKARQEFFHHLALCAAWLVQVQRSAHPTRRHNPILAVAVPKAVEPITVGEVEDVVKSGHWCIFSQVFIAASIATSML